MRCLLRLDPAAPVGSQQLAATYGSLRSLGGPCQAQIGTASSSLGHLVHPARPPPSCQRARRASNACCACSARHAGAVRGRLPAHPPQRLPAARRGRPSNGRGEAVPAAAGQRAAPCVVARSLRPLSRYPCGAAWPPCPPHLCLVVVAEAQPPLPARLTPHPACAICTPCIPYLRALLTGGGRPPTCVGIPH